MKKAKQLKPTTAAESTRIAVLRSLYPGEDPHVLLQTLSPFGLALLDQQAAEREKGETA